MNIKETFKYISNISIYTNKLMNDNDFLVQEANNINKNTLENIYNLEVSPKDGVIVKFRKDFKNVINNDNYLNYLFMKRANF